jgi:hypothetical protein
MLYFLNGSTFSINKKKREGGRDRREIRWVLNNFIKPDHNNKKKKI